MSLNQEIARQAPGRFWYLVALVLFIGSMLAPGVIVLLTVFGGGDNVLRLVAPETKTLRLERGTYSIFSDSRAVVDGEVVISQGSISGLRVTIRSAAGAEIPVVASSVPSRYSYGGQSGFSIFEFRIPETGNYSVSATYREASNNQRGLLSIRKDFLGGLLGSIFASVGVALVGTFLAVFIFLRTLWRRASVFRQVAVKAFTEQATGGRGTYTPPGSVKRPQPQPAQNDSPVQHQYERDK